MAVKTLENVTVSDAYLALMADRGVEYQRGRRLKEVPACH